MRGNIQQPTQAELETLIDRYFEATATEAEEEMLRQCLAKGSYRITPPVREALAVLSVTTRLRPPRSPRRLWITALSAAASLALLVTVGVHMARTYSHDRCEIYIAGVQVHDKELALKMMERDFDCMRSAHPGNVVADQLSDFMLMIENDSDDI